MSRSPHLLPPAAGPGGKAHGAGCLPCLCCQHEPSKTFTGRGYFTSAEQGLVGAGGERTGSRLLRGINALSSLTPIHILTWRAARFPGKQVIQSSCCPVMIFSLPRLPPQTQSRSLQASWGFLRPPQPREGQSSLLAYSFGCFSSPALHCKWRKADCALCSMAVLGDALRRMSSGDETQNKLFQFVHSPFWFNSQESQMTEPIAQPPADRDTLCKRHHARLQSSV